MDRVGTDEGYLIVFDRTLEVPWEERIFVRHKSGMGNTGLGYGGCKAIAVGIFSANERE